MIPFIDRAHHVHVPTSHTNNSSLYKGLMRILITGVTGQVGAALREALSLSATTIGADRSLLDLSQPEKIPSALDRFAPDLIVNPAAYTAVDRAEDEKELAFRVNAEAPGTIARWAASREVPVIHFSTDYVFNGAGKAALARGRSDRPSVRIWCEQACRRA
jgi:dTDP-4-dehydrorhamnose reductase